MPKPILSQKFLKSIYEYKDGHLYHLPKPDTSRFNRTFNTRYAGKTCGYCNDLGYIRMRITRNKKFSRYSEHSLIFLYHHGYMPAEIDHIDGNPSNNNINNLRDVTHQENGKNCSINKDNKSGFNGVYLCKKSNKWIAYIKVNYIRHHLGTFKEKQDAIEARMKANIEYGFHENHGRGKT